MIHFPTTVGEQFFSELTAERVVTRRSKFGVPMKVWERVRTRNESLDCAALCLAALRLVATPQRLVAWAKTVAEAGAAVPTDGTPPPPSPPPPPARRSAPSQYLERQRRTQQPSQYLRRFP